MGGSDTANGSHPGLALTEKQEKFIRLIAQGVDNSQACRTVGINRRTGTRWRYGRTLTNTAGEPVHYPPVTLPHRPVTVRSCRYLSLEERTTIADLHRHGVSVRSIARDLGRSASTVSRELRRNRDLTGRYLPNTAQRMASGRLLRPRVRRLALDDELAQVVCGLLNELTRRYPGQRARRVCPESIYQAIYDPDVRLTRPAKTALRTGRRRRRRRVQGRERRGRLVGMTMIDQRPAEVANRVQAGHWEGDSIMGSGNTSSIGTLVERRTRFIMLLHVPTGTRPAEAIRDAITTQMSTLPTSLRRTLTWDQGKEMAHHAATAQATGMGVYFCHAHSPWQRGSNENAPRKTLGWATPAALLDAILSTP